MLLSARESVKSSVHVAECKYIPMIINFVTLESSVNVAECKRIPMSD